MTHILHLDASARRTGSASREASADVVRRLAGVTDTVTRRDLAPGLPVVDEAWVGATFTPEADRTDDQRTALALSDSLVAELEAADTIVIGTPIYNFSVPAALKAWIDLVARIGRTFNYTETGPVGRLSGKRAIVVIASGGTQVGSEIDFASGYLRHVLGFLGITDVTILTPDAAAGDLPPRADAA